MIINEEIHGAWDQPTNTIVMQNVESSHLQTAAIQFADKVNLLMELNERSLRSIRTGGVHEEDDGRRKGHWEEDMGGARKNYANRMRCLSIRVIEACLVQGPGLEMCGVVHTFEAEDVVAMERIVQFPEIRARQRWPAAVLLT